MIRRVLVLGLSVVAVLAWIAVPAGAQQDTVILRSGNPVIGEVERLRRGSLEFDTEEMDLVKIGWEDIASVRSAGFFEVTVRSGAQYYGSLAGADPGMLVVGGLGLTDTLDFRDVVLIQAFERGFFARTNGYVDIGTNLTRANRLASLLANARFSYKGPKWGLDVTAESYWQRQESVSDVGDTTTQSTTRNSSSVGVKRFLGGRWVVLGSSQLEQNEGLELDRRWLALAGGGYQVVRTHGLEWFIGAGGTVNDERYVGEARTTTGEFVAGSTLDAFDIGDVDVYAAVTTYATPAGGGRVRVAADLRIAWEIFSDFTIGLNVTERYDSRPPSATAAQRDYQYALSVGWSWD